MKTKTSYLGLTFLFVLFFSFTSTSQDWVNKMLDPNANFYQTQSSFNTYWQNKPLEKGKGYKQFRRWESYMSPRVYPSGNTKLASKSYPNYLQWEAENLAAGIPKSLNGDWTILGPIGKPNGGGAGRINFIRFNPNDNNNIFVGAPDGGLWITTNGGNTWTTNTDQLTVIGCSDIAIDPSNPQVMYLATGDGDGSDTYSIGVLKSTDGGNSWNTTGLSWNVSQGRRISRLLINPTNPQIIMSFGSSGVYRSTDGGQNWVQPTGGTSSLKDAEFKPGDPNTVYTAGSSFKRSVDGGQSWSSVSTGLSNVGRMAIGVSAANPSYVYVLAANGSNNGFKGLVRSSNSGASFSTRSTSPNVLGWDNGNDTGGQGWYDLAIAVSPSNASTVFIGGVNMWKSTNGGSSWTLNSHWYGGYNKPYVHADIHDIVFLPGSASTIFSANDGGVFKSTNSGSAWSDISSNLAIAQQYRLGLSTSNPDLIVTGHQDNGSNLMDQTSWEQVYGGDGMDCFIDRTNNNKIFVSYVYGDYQRSTNGGNSFTSINSGIPSGDKWLSVWHQDPIDASTLYAGGRSSLYKSTNLGTSWSSIGSPSGSGAVIEFAIAPSNNQIIYALKQNAVSKSTNGGASFQSISSGLPTNAQPTYIAISDTDPNIAFVTYSGYSSNSKVFRTNDGGASWTNISSGLPNLPVNCVVYHNASSVDAIYIGTDVGVYYRDNSMNSWVEFSNNLPRCSVRDLEIYYPTNRLRAATFGRGTWDSDLYTSTPGSPIASFTVNNTVICLGQTAEFVNTSTGLPTSYNWSFPGGTPANSTLENPIITYNTPGTYDVSLTVFNAIGADSITQTSLITVVGGNGQSPPLIEGFTSATFPMQDWSVINIDNGATTWSRSATIGNAPTSGNAMFFDNYTFDDSPNTDEVHLPKVDFSNSTSAELTFDVAYARYSSGYSDGLQILISTDCGTSFTSVYSKSGSTLATANDIQSSYTPSSSEWRNDTVNLDSYIGSSNVIIAFRNLAGYGNRLFIDNINISSGSVPSVPSASFTSTPLSSSCQGAVVDYQSTSSGTPTSYNWTFQGGTPPTSTSQNPSVTYNTSGTFDVTLTVSNSLGSNTSSQTSYITINSTPTISNTIPSERCGPGTVDLQATSSSGSLTWYLVPNGGAAVGSGATFTTPNLNITTNFYVQATENGCSSPRTSVTATIKDMPSVDDPTSQAFCIGNSTAPVNFTGSHAASTYSWSNNNPAIGLPASGTGNIASFTPTILGNATITVFPSLNGCTGNTQNFTIVVQDCINLNEIEKEKIVIYPNPVNGNCTIESERLMDYKNLHLIDISGKLIQLWKIESSKMILDLSELSPGNYNLLFLSSEKEKTMKIQVVK